MAQALSRSIAYLWKSPFGTAIKGRQFQGGLRMDKAGRRLLETVFYLLAFIIITVVAYIRFDYSPSVLFAGSLALTFFVAAEIVLTR
jgi:hypothetical protein